MTCTTALRASTNGNYNLLYFHQDDVIADVLSIFSIVGCSVSIFCLLFTLIVYFALWR